MMAGLGEIQAAKSEKILKVLSEKPLFDFVDGNKSLKKLINKAIKKESGLGMAVAWNAFRIYKTLKTKLGLNPGSNFENWVTATLKNSNISTLADLKQLRKKLPAGLKNIKTDKTLNDAAAKMAIITSDITTHTKAEFPRMAELYWSNPDTIAPAKMVRASMSIPFFFEPFEIADMPNAGNENDPKWNKAASYRGPVPAKARFVDGGMLSNFPINVFHKKGGGAPSMPTFGARLSTYRESFSETSSMLGMSGAMISTMRQIYDYETLLKHPDYKKLICRIDADEQFNWLDFNEAKKDQVKLFNLGAQKALDFLLQFDWEGYKVIREKLSH